MILGREPERVGQGQPGKILILGAHYDTVPETPGADDNASAVAVLILAVAALLTLNSLSAFAQAGGGTGFNSTDLKTGISNSLAVIMMFGFVLGISAVIYGGFAIRRGDVDQGKMSIIGGAIIAAAPAIVFAFYKIFGLDSNSAVGVGNF